MVLTVEQESDLKLARDEAIDSAERGQPFEPENLTDDPRLEARRAAFRAVAALLHRRKSKV